MDELLRQLNIKLQDSRDMLLIALILGRTMPMVFLTPFLGGKLIPTEVKMGIGLLVSILVFFPSRDALSGPLPIDPGSFMMLMLKESFVGFVIGFVNSHIYSALDMAGRLIDTVRGTSMSEVQDPHSKQRETPVGEVYTQLFLVLFMAIGGHHIFMAAYFQSFVTLPLDRMVAFSQVAAAGFFDYMIKLTAELLVVAAIMSAPIVAATFITDVVFGILNRVAPQLNAYFMAMPVKALGGLVLMLLGFEVMTQRFYDYVTWALQTLEKSMAMLFVT
jgi:flagellar biosynthesis protein FliR